MHEEQTVEAVRWRMVAELGKARDAAEDNAGRARELHERAEEAIREENRREVEGWAREALEDPDTVVLSVATTGLHDPVDVVEMVALGVDGETVISERVRPDTYEAEAVTGYDDAGDPKIERRETGPVEIEDGAARMHGHTAESLADAPTLAELHPRLRETLSGKRVVVYNGEYVSRALSQTLERYGLGPLEVNVECAMEAYSRLEGTWSVDRETYYSVKLPGGDGSPAGNARALLALLRELAGVVSGGSSGSRDENDEDWEDIPFRARFPARVRHPLVF